jgi:hypothetical protein
MFIELVREKQCAKCGEMKKAYDYSPLKSSKDGLHAYCKACRNEYQIKRNGECGRTDGKTKFQPKYNPTAWLIPADPRTPMQRHIANAQQAWRYPVEPGPLVWNEGVRCCAIEWRQAA